MTIPKTRRDELEEIVNKFHEEYPSFSANGDIVQELDKIGFLVITAHLSDNLDGMILVDETSRRISRYPVNKLIFVNESENLYRSRFILSHELSHYIYERYGISDTNRNPKRYFGLINSSKLLLAARDHNVGYSNNPVEQEKDYMAAALLVPRDEFLKEIKEYLYKKNMEYTKSYVESLKTNREFLDIVKWKYKVEEKLIVRRFEEIAEDEFV